MNKKEIYFAAVGDVHGNMNKMVSMLQQWEQSQQINLSFVLQVGDFEAHRDQDDLKTMSAPEKYRKLGDFHQYYNNILKFPWKIYFIGGNHESYGFLDLHPKGTDVCFNCHYIGRANQVSIAGLKVSGLSGIYQENVFKEVRQPISKINKTANKDYIYFTEQEVEQVINFAKTDILLLHDWPEGIINPKDASQFENQRRSIKYDLVGNEYARLIIDLTAPKIVFCGHLHQKYQNKITLNNSHEVNIICMASVQQGWDSIALFKINKNQQIEQL